MKKMVLVLHCAILSLVIVTTNAFGSWEAANGPVRGNIRSFGKFGNSIYIGTMRTGIFVSNNNGISWKPASNGLTCPKVQAFASIGSSLFAGTAWGGVFVSGDSGKSWNATNDGLTNLDVWTFSKMGDNILFAGTYGGGVFRSNDTGKTWTAVNTKLSDLDVFSLFVVGSEILAGSFKKGIFRSTDSGATWTSVDSIITDILSFAQKDSTIYASTFGSGVALSTDSGKNWKTINNGLNDSNLTTVLVKDSMLFVSTYYTGSVFKSSNNGASWEDVTSTLMDKPVYKIFFDGNNLYAGTYQGVFFSSDLGISWSDINSGLTSVYVYTMTNAGNSLMAGTDLGPYISTDTGKTWKQANISMKYAQVRSFVNIDNNTFFAGSNMGVHVSRDKGATWDNSSTGLTSMDVRVLYRLNSFLYAGTHQGGMFISSNDGALWSPSNSGLTNMDVNAMMFTANNLLAATDSGVYISSDSGRVWRTTVNGLTGRNVLSIAAAGVRIFAGTENGLYFSLDTGSTWQKVASGPTSFEIQSLLVKGSALFAGTTGGGVFCSIDNGVTWTSINEGLETASVLSLFENGSHIFASTPVNGIYRRPLSTIFHSVIFRAGANGSVSGDTSQIVYHGKSSTPVKAIPKSMCRFTNWSGDIDSISKTKDSLVIAAVNADLILIANFVRDSSVVAFKTSAGGTLTGDTLQKVAYDSACTAVTAVPKLGYHFVKWSGDIDSANATLNPVTLTHVQKNMTLTAGFSINTYSVAFSADNNGSLSGTVSQNVDYGSSTTPVTAVASTGYHFVNWSGDLADSLKTLNPLAIPAVFENRAIKANFGINTYTVTFTAKPNGSITGTLSQTVNYNGSCSAVTAVAAPGYKFLKWSGDYTGLENPLTIANVTGNKAIFADFGIATGINTDNGKAILKNKFVMTPNPASQEGTIVCTFSGTIQNQARLIICDPVGNIVFAKTFSRSATGNKLSDVLKVKDMHIASGTYFVILTVDGIDYRNLLGIKDN